MNVIRIHNSIIMDYIQFLMNVVYKFYGVSKFTASSAVVLVGCERGPRRLFQSIILVLKCVSRCLVKLSAACFQLGWIGGRGDESSFIKS